MPMPWSYRHATKDFRAFLADAQDRLGTPTENMTYTAVDGVLRTFRARLTPDQGMAFAQVLPAVLRAMFIQDWDLAAPPRPFGTRAEMTAEAQSLRPHHNLTPDTAIDAVAVALWRHVDHRALERVLADLPDGAIDFWTPDVNDPAQLARRIT
jgi:uncharacterized protein (DUF2267 family)